jgi:hypothetical protein
VLTVTSSKASGDWPEQVSGDSVVYDSKIKNRIPWTPQLSDTYPPEPSLVGLVDDAEKTADLAALILQRIHK